MKPFRITYKTQSGNTLEFTQYANSIGEALQIFKLARPDVEVIMVCSAIK